MTKKTYEKSRFLSFILRHNPSAIGITLDENGWVDVEELSRMAQAHNKHLTVDDIFEIVRTNEKKRFSLSSDSKRIRAAQGHSINVNLGIEPIQPPDILFHGTAKKSIEKIRENGLLPMSRDFVHLSADEATAFKVGMRHGKPYIIQVDALGMSQDGHPFYRAENGVWLAKSVAAKYLVFTD